MMRRTQVWLAALAVLTGMSAGCGRGGERNKNLDHDRPKATDRR
ncbi:hypothetical protein [Urbifossiella limnaea]|nr:hypothetical protein [Urbifossiella limnaea]